MKPIVKLKIRFGIALFIFIIISSPFIMLPRKFHFKFLYPIFNFIFLFASKIRVHNLSKIVFKHKEPVIFASSHKCFADFSIVSKFVRMPFTIIIKKEKFDNIFFKIIEYKMRLILVDRWNLMSQLDALKKAINIIKNDRYSIIIFPEGSYNFDMPIGGLKGGLTKIAESTKARVIPIAIYGIDNRFINENKLVWKDAYLKFGEPILYEDSNDREKFMEAFNENVKRLYEEIESNINKKGIK